MTLGEKRRKFSHMLAMLVLHAEDLGFGVAIDDVKRRESCGYGHPRSAHRVGLAGDILLYKGSRYLTAAKHHEALHDYWDILGGAPRIAGDMNHYSLEHQGVR